MPAKKNQNSGPKSETPAKRAAKVKGAVAASLSDVVRELDARKASKPAAKKTSSAKPAAKKTSSAKKAAPAKRATTKAVTAASTRAKPGENYVAFSRRSRITGTLVETVNLSHADSEHAPKGDLTWARICVEHGTVDRHARFRDAWNGSSNPTTWCKKCAKAAEPKPAARTTKRGARVTKAAPKRSTRRK